MSDYLKRRRIAWGHPTKNIKVGTFEIFFHKGEAHSSERKEYFFGTDEELSLWMKNMESRASGDGPASVHVDVTDFEVHKRYMESHTFDNPDTFKR